MGAENGRILLHASELSSRGNGGKLLLDVVSVTVRAGEIYCLLGAAGAGKTTLVHSFLGFTPPSAGTVLVDGTDPSTDPVAARQRITYVARGASMYRSMTARDNVAFFTSVSAGDRQLTRSDHYNAMRRVGIPERDFERRARNLDAGSLLRLWLAICLLKNTPVLLFDEPTAGLDLYAATDVQQTLLEFRRHGKGVLIATTDILLAGRVADRVGLMREGRLSLELTQRELIDRPLHDIYLEYIGRPVSLHGVDGQAVGASSPSRAGGL